MNEQLDQKLLLQAKQLFANNDLSQAAKVFLDIIEIEPNSIDAYFYLGNIFHIKGSVGKAIKAFNKVLELDPGHTDASISLSVLLNDIGKYEQAKSVFDKAKDIVKNIESRVEDPHIEKKFATKHYELAELYSTYSRFDEALAEYQKVLSLDPQMLETHLKIAKIYAKKGYSNKAFEVLRKLKSDHPNFIPTRVALGLLHYSNGNVVEANKEWEMALEKDPSNQELQMYLNISNNASETNLKMH
jgi:tetratricopeptide (TPR) repeat protein